MGQYYSPVNLDAKAYLYSHEYGAGLKLMEHAWLGTRFVGAVYRLLANEWKGHRIVWAGDYGDEGLFLNEFIKDSQNYKTLDGTLYSYASENFKKITPPISNEETDALIQEYPYLLCLDKKEFVNLHALPKMSDGWSVHPLPLLTANGNGRGGGDYRDSYGIKYVGSWSGMHIAAEKEEPIGFLEIKPDFREDE